MLSSVGGHGVHRLHRECFGSLTLADMDVPVGMMRPMTEEEISKVEIHPHPQLSPSPLTLALTLTLTSHLYMYTGRRVQARPTRTFAA